MAIGAQYSTSPLGDTNMSTVKSGNVVTGQVTCDSSAAVQITTNSGPCSHGIFLVAKDSASYYIGLTGVSATTGVKVSANNPIFIPIHDPSVLYAACGGSSKVLSYILY